MKKYFAILLVLALTVALAAGCAPAGPEGTEPQATTTAPQSEQTEPPAQVTTEAPTDGETQGADPAVSPLSALIAQIYEVHPVALMLGDVPDEMVQEMIPYYTGLESDADLADIVVSEPMMSSIAYSLVVVQVKDASKAHDVATQMKDNIDPRKWGCVSGDDLMVAGKGDIVMLVMVDSQFAEGDTPTSAQDIVDAFQQVMGGELDFAEEGEGKPGGVAIPMP